MVVTLLATLVKFFQVILNKMAKVIIGLTHQSVRLLAEKTKWLEIEHQH